MIEIVEREGIDTVITLKIGDFEKSRQLYDSDEDGWCDLWCAIFQKLVHRDRAIDTDGDGLTDYQEMVLFQDPFVADPPPRVKLPGDLARDKAAAHILRVQARLADRKKVTGFSSAVENRRKEVVEEKAREAESTSFLMPMMRLGALGPGPLWIPDVEAMVMLSLLCLPPAGSPDSPCILAYDTLSTGEVMLAWEGPSDTLYTIEWSEDLQTWRRADSTIPVMSGVGTWSDVGGSDRSHPVNSPHRFYRVVNEEVSVDVSDPDGGNGTTTFGGLISNIQTFGPGWVSLTITANIPAGETPTVLVYVDGQPVGLAEGFGGGTWGFDSTTVGGRNYSALYPHTVYAVICNLGGTTQSDENPLGPTGGIWRTPDAVFTTEDSGSPPLWAPYVTHFDATEHHIDASDPGVEDITEIRYSIGGFDGIEPPYESYEWSIRIRDEGGALVREFEGEETPSGGIVDVNVAWDGTNSGGAPVTTGLYYIENDLGNFLNPLELIAVHVGPKRTMLVITEEMRLKAGYVPDNLYPEWRGKGIFSTGHTADDERSWDPTQWAELGSPTAMVKHGVMAIMAPEGRAGKWKLDNRKGHDPNWNVAAAFDADNLFNEYDLGMFIGHGVASNGGVYTPAGGAPVTLPRQSYFPILRDRNTGQTYWWKSGEMAEKFGVGGKLKWMFALTCNYLRVGAHNSAVGLDIFDDMVANNRLPIDDQLHMLCGYTTSIMLDTNFGKRLCEGLMQKPVGVTSIVEAWEHAWKDTENQTKLFNGRSVYWPECANDTIYGVPTENVYNQALPAGRAQGILEFDDTRFP